MTRLISILVLSGFLFQNFSKVLILADYEWNKEYISKTLCENKNKPQSHCNGKCHLKKQLAKEEKRESAPVNNPKWKSEIQLFSQKAETDFPVHYVTGNLSFAPFQLTKTTSPVFTVFHPPAV
ncbi:MAG: hypothetical protein M3R17_14075 [Bacteroidota bacterium]|nr:hypothetical protein [Bacteroidota bacterium]